MSDDLVGKAKALDQMDLAELKAKHLEVFGTEPLTRNTKVLREQIKRCLHLLEIDRKKSEIPPKAGKERASSQPAEGDESMNATATTQISRLQKMGLKDLQAEYETVFGKPTKSRNRKQLFAQIAKKLQEGDGAAEPASPVKPTTKPAGKPTITAKFEPKRKAKKTAKTKGGGRPPKPIGARDPRLPKVGTTIERTYKGKKLLVRVLEKGFEFEGKDYRSLSALAKHITGQIINGFLFFQLGQYAKQEKTSK